MSRNWIRKAKITIPAKGGSVDVSELRITFNIYRHIIETPNAGSFRIYNVSRATAVRFIDPTVIGQKLRLEAGYDDHFGPIFEGEIKWAITGRESPTDTFVDFFCADGYPAYENGTVSKTFDAGSTQRDMIDHILKSWPGITEGMVKGISNEKYPKAITLHGMSRDIMRDIAKSISGKWWLDSGKLYLLPLDSDEKTTFGSVVLNVDTGLVGMPQETPQGIIVTALIHPSYAPGVELIIDHDLIQRAAWSDLSVAGQVASAIQYEWLGLEDGHYTIDAVEWRGDTRGGDWYAIMTCHGNKSGHSKMPNAIPRQLVL